MLLTRHEGVVSVAAETYRLTCAADRPYVYLDNEDGERIAELFVLSSVHPLHDRDDTVQIGPWQATLGDDEIVLELAAVSSVWQGKTYRFRCTPRRLSYEIEVRGAGRLAEVNYFGGYYSGQTRWGSGFFVSGQCFHKGFNPEPNTKEINYFVPSGGSTIDLMGVPLPGRNGWFFTPPPFAFAFEMAGRWLGLGVEAQPGSNRFTEYTYHGQLNSFHLTLAYEGHTTVAGSFRLPAIGFDFGADEYQVLAGQVAALRAAGALPDCSQQPRPTWWQEPIFSGWGAQCYVASQKGGIAPEHARQSVYEGLLDILEMHGICPGIVIIDDKWQDRYGINSVDSRKWPDLQGFIARQHAAGRRVLLWLKAWDPEGVPAEECITNAAGLPLAVDPTNPAYAARLAASIREMIGPDGYGADGFKIDFSARIPSGPGIRLAGDTWGLELMRTYLGLIHDTAKLAKPDALIMAHTPHPYLAGVVDMIRLNDINTDKNVTRAMQLRARVAALACPDALIDTDNWPITDRATWRQYTRLQPQLGVPSLYYASHIDSTGEPLEPSDYALIRDTWQAYRLSRAAAVPAGLAPEPTPAAPPEFVLEAA